MSGFDAPSCCEAAGNILTSHTGGKVFASMVSAVPVFGDVLCALSDIKETVEKCKDLCIEMKETSGWVDVQGKLIQTCLVGLGTGGTATPGLADALQDADRALYPLTALVKGVERECRDGKFESLSSFVCGALKGGDYGKYLTSFERATANLGTALNIDTNISVRKLNDEVESNNKKMLSRFDSMKIAREAQGKQVDTQFTDMMQELKEAKTAEYLLLEKVTLLHQTLEDPESGNPLEREQMVAELLWLQEKVEESVKKSRAILYRKAEEPWTLKNVGSGEEGFWNYGFSDPDLQITRRSLYKLNTSNEWVPDPANRSWTEGKFHQINLNYPSLKMIHTEPSIYIVPGFLSKDECERLMRKTACGFRASYCGDLDGKVSPSRTSEQIECPRREIPTIVEKITSLLNCRKEQLEVPQILRYTKGQRFTPHHDGIEGKFSTGGFVDSARLATLFVYLVDVPNGGETNFPLIGLSVKPKKGMAVIHFPTTTGGTYHLDRRTMHEGGTAVDEKWLLATWLWENDIAECHKEDTLPSLYTGGEENGYIDII